MMTPGFAKPRAELPWLPYPQADKVFVINAHNFTPSAPFSPLDVGVSLWLDASDALTLYDAVSGGSLVAPSGTVARWEDKSGNARHLTQSNSVQRPLRMAGDQNGLDVLTFDGSNDIISSDSVSAAGLNNVTVISVFRMIAGGGTEDLPMGIGTTQTTGQVRCFYRAANSTSLGFASWARDVPTSSISLDIGGSYHLFGFGNSALSGTGNVLLMRDGSIVTATSGGAMSATQDGFSVGSLRGGLVGFYYTHFSCAEILVFYSFLDVPTRQQIEGYLAHKWGLTANLPSDHPYKSVAP